MIILILIDTISSSSASILLLLKPNGLDDSFDLYYDVRVSKTWSFDKVRPLLNIPIAKRGITLIQNVYVGFDTEYVLKDKQKSLNELLSKQTAVQSRTIIKVPLYTLQDISYIHPLTSEISNFYKPKESNFETGMALLQKTDNSIDEFKIINNSIKTCLVTYGWSLFPRCA